MKASEITKEFMAGYLRMDMLEETEQKEIATALSSAKEYVKSYTGLSAGEIDQHEDITSAVLILAADMFENKNFYLDYKNRETNQAVDAILGMYSMNLI